jgi:PAS domain S-box-containing protein
VVLSCLSDGGFINNFRRHSVLPLINALAIKMAEESDHISRIIDTVLKAAKGDHSVRVDPHNKDDELKPLCHAINKMVESMRKQVKGFRQVEVDLKKTKEKYRRLKENIPGMVFLFAKHPDGSYSFPYANAASRQLFNIDPDDLMRDSTLITRLIHPYDRERFEESVKQSEETLQPWREELRHVVNGEVRWYDCMSRPEKQSNGDILWDGIILEITDRKQLEEQLLQSQKMEAIGQLAGGVAHDFNNMLSVILGYSELIKSGLPAGNPLLKDVLEIEKAASHSRDITRQLLAFSRKQIIAPKTIDLNKLIMQTKKTLSRLIGEDIHLRFLPKKNLGKVRFDPSQIDQILVNLAVNARDAMPDGGMLTIEISKVYLDEDYCRLHIECRPGHYVLMMVSDDGAGMKKETQSHIFEPFFTTKEVGKGTGLGLATVYGIVKQNGGYINVYSELGRGTTFKIYIPRIMEEDEVRKNTEEVPLASGSGTVLLVEDDDMVRRMTSAMLKKIGYKVIAAETPLNALSYCEKENMRIDILLTDVVMPKMSGKELRDKIKAIRPDIKVLFMSGYTADVILHHGVIDEGVYFVQKPFSLNDLACKIRNAVEGR